MPRTDALSILAALFMAASPAAGQSDYSRTPFRDEPVLLAQAAAIERIGAAARALAAIRPPAKGTATDAESKAAAKPDEAEDDEGEEGGPIADLALIRARLAAASPQLARALAASLDEMAEAAEANKDATEPANKVVALLEKARAAI